MIYDLFHAIYDIFPAIMYDINDIMNEINNKRPFPWYEQSWYRTALLKLNKYDSGVMMVN